VPAIAVPAFALTWWMASYLVARDPARPVLRRAATGLVAYALAVAGWTIAPHVDGLTLDTAAQVLLCVPALAWAGAAVGLLPDDLPERRHIDRGWLLTSGLLLLMVPALPPAGRLVVLAPLIGGLVLLWRFHDRVEPKVLAAPLTAAAALYAGGLAAVLIPVDMGAPILVIAAIGVDLAVLGFLVAVADAVVAGERLRPDLRRSAVAATGAAVVFGGPASLTMLTAPGPAATALQFVLVAAAMTLVGLAGPVHRALDRLAFVDDERLRLDRVAALLVAEALPRRRQRHLLPAMREEEFLRFTRRALDHYADLGRLLRNPLIDLPTVERRLAARGRPYDQPLVRAVELRALLRESITGLKPPGLFGTTEEWRYYNALHFCCVVGLRPYRRRVVAAGLDRDARRALEWFRGSVPQRSLRQWQATGSRMVARQLWRDLAHADPKWPGRVRPTATRGTDRHYGFENG
jgi:hypothetical protein